MENDNNNDDNDNRKPTIEFADGCFEGWTGTDAELDQLIDEIVKMANESGMGYVVVQSETQVMASDVSIDDYAQELSADYVPKK
jgi:hypothetical protein